MRVFGPPEKGVYAFKGLSKTPLRTRGVEGVSASKGVSKNPQNARFWASRGRGMRLQGLV